ncbi:MAG TPA: c(7)-type cytochrome triheme domain-containing protein [Longimicrobium sp.]|nr:c(7)-type cytochrome triheme domain-containing protein [Longimicrobium sp.]
MRLDAKWLAAAAGVVLGGAALAADLPGLPRELRLPQSKDSPGVVAFRHESHVDTGRPDCVACHPRRFGILGRSSEQRGPAITHAAMEKGEACGGCHGAKKDGKDVAFGFDDCTGCHAK